MFANITHLMLLVTSFASIFALASFKPKRLEHYLFAILAFSLLLLAISELLPDSFAVEQQFVALGTFATCNIFWLLCRSLFRKGNALSTPHYALAAAIALLILFSKSIDIIVTLQWIEQETLIWLKRMLSETLRLLSSGVLILAFWEIIRGYSSSNKSIRRQKTILIGSMVIAVFSTRILVPSIPLSPEVTSILFDIVRSLAASLMIISIFTVLFIQYKDREALGLNSEESNLSSDEDEKLLKSLTELMEENQLYLESELKMMDVAANLNVPEYRISRVLKEKTSSENFNHFVNSFRIDHAKKLLLDKQNEKWTILVISMESGFASLATFNRVFKTLEGCSPNQYRKKMAVS